MSNEETRKDTVTTEKTVVRNRSDATVSKRPRRKTLRTLGPLACDKRPGYVRRWVNDTVGRIDRMMDFGYDHAKDENGDNIYRMSRTGDDIFKVFLMEIPQDLYDEAQLEKAEMNRMSIKSLNRPLDIDRENQYNPLKDELKGGHLEQKVSD